MQEHFVGYLLGSLDQVTHARVEAFLNAHPAARDRLRLVEEALAPLADDAIDSEPPPGLAMATLARIAEHRCRLPQAPRPSASQAGAAPRRHFRRADWIVAAVVLLLAGGVILPFLSGLWVDQQRVACANNLRKFWMALSAYGDRNEGELPRVEAAGPRAVAGIFVPLLTDAGLARDVSLGCPARGTDDAMRFTVADLERKHRDTPDEYRAVAGQLSGHYAYSLGYQEGGKLRGLRRSSSEGLPILADRSDDLVSNSSNHAGRGQNVLYVGGHVRWAVQPTVGEQCDHIYMNHHNQVGAGVCRFDSVLGASDARPYVGE